MTFIAVRSLPLSEESKAAWRSQGAIYPRRGSNTERILELAANSGAEFILNLGKSQFTPTDDLYPGEAYIWNHGEDTYPLLWPGMTRTLYPELLPPHPDTYPTDVWIKTPGHHGRGKFHKNVGEPLTLPREWDWQAHIDGTEFRVLTVGPKVVQQFHRLGDNDTREYVWISNEECPSAVKNVARVAAGRLYGFNVIGWDLIMAEDTAYLLEGNSCPGMSPSTAERIVNEIRAQKEIANA